jgi:carbamate kinase
VATLLTQVVVDGDDPAFGRPTKPIGPEGMRRLVASPEPIEIVELATIGLLVEAGVTVICGGGGGIPVVRDRHGGLHGVEAVIDKDLFAALLATSLDADALLLLTDVPAVYAGFGTHEARAIPRIGCQELRGLSLPVGSMGPKAEAACRFVGAGGRVAAIGALEEAMAVLEGRAGTQIQGLVDAAVRSPLRRGTTDAHRSR